MSTIFWVLWFFIAFIIVLIAFTLRKEKEEIHQKDVREVLAGCNNMIIEKRNNFEKYRTMTDLIANIQANSEETVENNEESLETQRLHERNAKTMDIIEHQNACVSAMKKQ